MKENNKVHTKRLRNLIGVSSLSAIVLLVASFAWFIGMQTVSVNSFDIEIATVDSLMLSLDGQKWETTVSINKDNYNDVAYTGNTNHWGGLGLKPVSTIGEMDVNSSRMKLYEKSSLRDIPGGKRVMASRVNNHEANYQDGYVVFDLFIRNMSGPAYYDENDLTVEEQIYLTTDSLVVVDDNDGVENTGIENSLRVAFAQIGRVHGETTDHDVITAIGCNPDVNNGNLPSIIGGVTGICRTAQIWEPNDTAHAENAIGYYETLCLERKAAGTNAYVQESYDLAGNCGTVVDGTSYPTYAVKEEIASSDNVNLYDGAAYNKYLSTTKLQEYSYFTDTHKEMVGKIRPAFMTLAPNSITKVRVYVFLEGQDIDNYDWSVIGKQIKVNFGFTKIRYNPEDIGDYGQQFVNEDTVKPVITLNGNDEVTVQEGATYEDLGATASDLVDGDITDKIKTINPVDTSTPGVYYVAYDVSDWAGNWADRVVRTVTVVAN